MLQRLDTLRTPAEPCASFRPNQIGLLAFFGIACQLLGACSPSSGTKPATGATARQSMFDSVPTAGTSAVASGGTGGAIDFGGSSTTPVLSTAGSNASFNNSGPLGCMGLECQQHMCPSGSTSISGRVYDPAAKNPLYNVAVYIPNEPVDPIKLGASCDPCTKLYTGKAVVSTLTDANGAFTLANAPDGANIPLIIQIGKWRKQLTIPSVAPCQANSLPDKSLTLPRNHKEGDIPNIAISTGGADTLECLLRRVGVDASEYIPGDTGDGRIHIFQGAGAMGGGLGGIVPGLGLGGPAPNTSPAAPSSPMSLWNDVPTLMKYDVLLLSCEGAETTNMNQQALHDYADAGGRIFASHFHYSWFNSGPYANENLATWTAGANPMLDISANIVTTFPKGQALQQWLMNTNALTNGELPIKQARHNADVGMANTVSQAWINADQSANPPGATQYFSFNTPTTAAMTPDGPGYCGRVVFSDLHVGGATMDDPSKPVPTGCQDVDLSPQEKALEFMLFDLSSCVIPDNRPPLPPPVLM